MKKRHWLVVGMLVFSARIVFAASEMWGSGTGSYYGASYCVTYSGSTATVTTTGTTPTQLSYAGTYSLLGTSYFYKGAQGSYPRLSRWVGGTTTALLYTTGAGSYFGLYGTYSGTAPPTPTPTPPPTTYTYTTANDGDLPSTCQPPAGVGVNPINPYKGNLSRQLLDITTYGAAPVTFQRIYNSREQNFGAGYRDFGTNGGWQHNWNYELLHLTSQTNGFDDVRLRYPDGRDHVFQAKDTTGQEYVPPARSGDRLFRWSGTIVGYTLATPDGAKYDFQQNVSAGFDLNTVRDGQSFVWTITHDANHEVERITNNFGRWIELERGLVGGAEVITKVTTDDLREVTFDYTAWTPTSEQTLTSVAYPGGEEAAYTWVGADSLITGRPLLGTADDPMYGGAGARTKYVYNYSFTFDDGAGPYLVTGVVKEERNLVSDQVVVSLPNGSGSYPKILEGNGTEITRKFVSGQLVESRDGEERTTTYAYGAGGQGFLTGVTEPNGATTTFIRDSVGRPLAAVDTFGRADIWSYNTAGFALTYTNKRNYLTRTTRDTSNRPTRRDHPDATYETWTYDSNGLPLTHRLRNTGTNIYTYNAGGNIATFTDAESKTWTYTYDTSGQLATETDPRSNVTTYDYDWRGQLLSVTHPDTTVRSFEYDDYGNRTKVTDELNNVTEYTYNEYNRLVGIEDPLNRITAYEYGREPGCGSCGFSAVVTKITLPSGRIVENTYDLSWKLLTRVEAPGTADEATTTLAYNAGGDVATLTNAENETTTFTYDLLHRRLTATDPQSHTTSWTYDPEGNLLTEKLADNSQTTFEYDTLNRRAKITNSLNQVTQFTYTGGDQLLTLKDARNNTYTFEYDKRNLQTKKTYPGGSYEQWTYDNARNVTTYRTRAAQVLTLTNDNRNRPTVLDWSGSTTPDVSRTYDAVGRVLTIDNANSEITFTYDDAGQLLTEEQKILAPALTKTVTYTYTDDGLRASLTYPDTKAFSYTYTERNQLADIDFNLLVLNPLVHYTYDLAGRRVGRSMNNMAETEYAYDSAGRLTSVEQKNASGTFDRRDYGYNVVNSRTWEKRDSLLGDAYAYDTTRQVTGVQYDAATPDGTPANPLEQTAFAYDAAGNRTTVTQTTGTNAPVPTSYTANTLNQYTAVGGLTVTNDTNGNLATSVSGTYTYDAQNRLTAIATGTNTVSLAYDGLNRAVTRTVNGTATHLVYDREWNVIEEYDSGGTQLAAMAYGAATDEPIFRWASGYILSYYHQDALGNVTTLTDTSGIPVESYRYDVYGKPTIYDPYLSVRTASFFGNPYMFTGREFLPEAGLYQYRNRAYSPGLGRFLQTDPIGFGADDPNIYRAVSNNPINAVDPDGLQAAGPISGVLYHPFTGAALPPPSGPPPPALIAVSLLPFAIPAAMLAPELALALALRYSWLVPASALGYHLTSEGGPSCPTMSLFHKGNLANGAVSAAKSLSTGMDEAAVNAIRGGELHEFKVPADVLDGWLESGAARHIQDSDLVTGVLNSGIQVFPPTSGQMNQYMVPKK